MITAYSVKVKESKYKKELNIKPVEIIKLNTYLLYADVVEYTQMAAKLGVIKSFKLLQTLYSNIDHISHKYSLHKIDLIGDCYSIASMYPGCVEETNQLNRVIKAAKEIQRTVNELAKQEHFKVRIGIHRGEVYWAKIGNSKRYDIFGEHVRIAQELQNFCVPDRIIISQNVKIEDKELQKSVKELSEYSFMSYFI